MISLILPTYNEAKNLPELLERASSVLGQQEHEIIIVDDNSPDKTWQAGEELQQKYPRLRVLRRIGRRGLSSAVVEGFAMATGDILIVMDADLQHDPMLILRLTEKIDQGADIAVASRYIEGGSVGEWITGRRILSKTATYLAQKLPNVETTDPMSGFFAVRASSYRPIAAKLRPTGFKILLEVLTFLPRGSTIGEVPLVFQMRKYGESKLSFKVEMQFLWQLLRILVHRVSRWGTTLFFLVCLIIAAVLVPRVWNLRTLYLDPAMRSIVQTQLETIAEQRGWLISNISVTEVTTEGMRIIHTEHHRALNDQKECFEVSFASSNMQPCND